MPTKRQTPGICANTKFDIREIFPPPPYSPPPLLDKFHRQWSAAGVSTSHTSHPEVLRRILAAVKGQSPPSQPVRRETLSGWTLLLGIDAIPRIQPVLAIKQKRPVVTNLIPSFKPPTNRIKIIRRQRPQASLSQPDRTRRRQTARRKIFRSPVSITATANRQRIRSPALRPGIHGEASAPT